jgi:hypothetical protein
MVIGPFSISLKCCSGSKLPMQLSVIMTRAIRITYEICTVPVCVEAVG